MLRIGTIVVGASDVRRAVAFWSAALDYVPRDGVVNDDFVVLVPRHGHGPGVSVDSSESPVQEYPRVHLDLYADDADEQEAQVERLVSLGASRVDWEFYPDDPDFVVLADTEGNRFCIIDTAHGG